MGDEAGPSKVLTRLRVTGACIGFIEVSLDEWTVKDLREEVSRRSGFSLRSVNMISCGRFLEDFKEGEVSSPTLREAGFKENTDLLITRVGGELGNAVNHETDRSEGLSRLKAAVDADAENRDTENESGDKLIVPSAAIRKALVTGIMLHETGRDLIRSARYKDASEVLALAVEAYSHCDAKLLENVDNPAFLQLDMVWCWFLLRDTSRLENAQERLSKVRERLQRSHGSNLERLQVRQGVSPELAIYVRLELLEGVVSFHSGNYAAARQSLVSARSKYQQVQVPDRAMAQLAAMGFETVESTRALLKSGQDLGKATDFILEERIKKLGKRELERRLQRELKERESFGRTPGGEAVKMKRLANLRSMGYEKRVAAEALRVSENNIERAVDILSNPDSLLALQISLSGSTASTQAVDGVTLERILSTVLEGPGDAPQSSSETTGEPVREAVERLVQALPAKLSLQTETNPTEIAAIPLKLHSATSISNRAAVTTQTHDAGQNTREHADGKEEMQDELENTLGDLADGWSGDHVRDYYLEVKKEGDAIEKYLALLNDL